MYVCSTAILRRRETRITVAWDNPLTEAHVLPHSETWQLQGVKFFFVFARRQAKRATKRVVGTSKKCGCKKQYFFSELNSDTVRIVSPQTVSVRDLVRR